MIIERNCEAYMIMYWLFVNVKVVFFRVSYRSSLSASLIRHSSQRSCGTAAILAREAIRKELRVLALRHEEEQCMARCHMPGLCFRRTLACFFPGENGRRGRDSLQHESSARPDPCTSTCGVGVDEEEGVCELGIVAGRSSQSDESQGRLEKPNSGHDLQGLHASVAFGS